ncbi:MAG: Rieske 2Fe-2S domain-containing protein [Planctomycetes bacterium]|nr:Rieske 2Fe-2S domain-containing protein [Planctomycetota bacterium]
METFDPAKWLRVGTLADLEARGVQQVKGAKPAVAVFLHGGEVFAVDNRCPHMGYPLHRGTVKDGVLTCHWHHSNYDLCSGCSFSLFADDVPTYETHVEKGIVYVAAAPRRTFGKDDLARRLFGGLDQNIAVVIAKSVDLLFQANPSGKEVIREVAQYGSARHSMAGSGMTSLSVAANLLQHLDRQTGYYALYKATKMVAENCAGRAPRMLSEPLDTDAHGMDALSRWFRRWAENGQVTGCERTILTVARTPATTPEISALFFRAATDRMYAQGGQSVPMSNKGFELIEHIGRDYAKDLLPLLVRWVSGRGSGAEDQHPWNNPVDLVTPLRAAEKSIAGWLEVGKGKTYAGEDALKEILLGDDPHKIIDSLGQAMREGAPPAHLAKLVAYAAARRLAHFALTNELQDWMAPQRTFAYANAIHQVVKRSPSDPELVRGIFHGAISVYMDRFLNVPAVRLPGERNTLDGLPSDPQKICAALLELLDHQAHVEDAAGMVARFVRLKHPLKALYNTLTFATVREDLGFPHWLVLEAGIQQALEWEGRPEAEHILVGVVRHLAVVCPTPRAQIKSAQVGLRLNKGERLYETKEEALAHSE